MDPLIPSLFSLFITYLQERRRSSEAKALDPAAFQAWLREEAIPQLLSSAEEHAETLAAMQLSSKGQLDQITAMLQALSVQVQVVVDQTRKATPEDVWGALSAECHDILAALVAVAEDSGELDRPLKHEELAARVRSPAAVLKLPAKGLAERGHLRFNEFSGGWAVSLTPRGFVFTQLARELDATRAAVGALARSLPAEGVSTVAKIAEAAGTGLPLALAVVSRCAELQLLEASPVHPPERSRVLNVQQVLLEARSDEVAVELLKLV